MDDDFSSLDDAYIAALRNKLDRLHQDQALSYLADKIFEGLGSTVEVRVSETYPGDHHAYIINTRYLN